MVNQGLILYKFFRWILILLYFTHCAKCESKEIFYRTDIRLSQFGDLLTTGICSTKEECAFRCLINTDCHNVRLFPLSEGFFSERLTVETCPDDRRRIYEDLNGEPYILGPIGNSDHEEARLSDESFVRHGPVTKINIWSGYVIDGLQITYGSVPGNEHGDVILSSTRYRTLRLSENEYISRIRWGVCQGSFAAFDGCVCSLFMETNKGHSVGPLGYGDVGEFHDFHGHRLLYVNSSSAVVSGYLVITKMTMQFGFHF